jgi:hypothetical protein
MREMWAVWALASIYSFEENVFIFKEAFYIQQYEKG